MLNKVTFGFITAFTLVTNSLFAQKAIPFKLYCRDQLTHDSIFQDRAYSFTAFKDSAKFQVNSNSGICFLPAKGIYKLSVMGSEYPLSYNYYGQTADTLNWPKLNYIIANPHLKHNLTG